MPFEILCREGEQTVFNRILLDHIERGDVTPVLSILEDVENPCQLTDSTGTTLLHYAARYGNKTVVEHLLDFVRPNVDILNDIMKTPLMYAVEFNQVGTALLLFQSNADIFMLDASGRCALGRALDERHQVNAIIGRIFLEKVSADSLTDSKYVGNIAFHRDCPLWCFMPLNKPVLTEILLVRGSPVDGRSPVTEETALHRAVQQLNIGNIELLLEWNADVNAKRFDGRMPIQTIENFRDQDKVLEVLKILIDAGAQLIDRANLSTELPIAPLLKHGNREIVRTLLLRNLDWEFKDASGKTLLHHLARNKFPDILEVLRGYEFDINTRAADLKTMLHHAILMGNVNSATFILDHGADVNVIDSANNSPLSSLIHPMISYDSMSNRALQNYLDCVELLVERGADCQLFTEETQITYNTFFQQPFQCELMTMIEPVIAHLAIYAESGGEINEFTLNKIETCTQFKDLYESYKVQVDKVKSIRVDESLELIDFMFMSDRQISLYARKKRFAPNKDRIMKACDWSGYFERALDKRLSNVTELVNARVKLENMLYETIKDCWNTSIYGVAENIVNMMGDQDILSMKI